MNAVRWYGRVHRIHVASEMWHLLTQRQSKKEYRAHRNGPSLDGRGWCSESDIRQSQQTVPVTKKQFAGDRVNGPSNGK